MVLPLILQQVVELEHYGMLDCHRDLVSLLQTVRQLQTMLQASLKTDMFGGLFKLTC